MSTTQETTKQGQVENAVTTFEAVERRLAELQEKAARLNGEMVKLRDQAERTVRDIAAAGERADNELARYRSLLHEGEKTEADGALGRVSEQRTAVKNLRKSLGELLPCLGKIRQEVEAVHLAACTFIEILFDFQLRLRNVSVLPSRVMASAGHTGAGLDKLSEYIRRHSV